MAEQRGALINASRAIGQGLGMGWGDEGEAWLRSKLSDESYEDALKRIRNEYAQFSTDYPYTSGALELASGALPGVAAMLVPGGQPAGAAQLARTGAGALARLAASPAARTLGVGMATGAVTGAGSAEEGNRLPGAAVGTGVGGAIGLAAPVAVRATMGAGRWLRDKLFPTEAVVADRAAGKMSKALKESGLSPSDITAQMTADRKMRVPSVVANVDPALADLAETVAQRTGASARNVEKKLTAQKLGSRERTYQQTVRALGKGDFYGDEQRMLAELRSRANTLYDKAYEFGNVDDPRIMEVLNNKEFNSFFNKGKEIAQTEALAAKLRGDDPNKYLLKDIYKFDMDPETKVLTPKVATVPDVRTLDYIKRGIDATITNFYQTGKSTEANALKELRKVFVNAIDENVPAYKIARAKYAGDIEAIDALRKGMDDFNKMDHEEVTKLVAGMSDTEKEAFRTGVVRDIYSRVMNPSTNMNAAQRIIGSPEMQAKLQPLFDSASSFRLFKAALERESQLFQQSNKILGGSPTGKRGQMREVLEEGDSGVGETVANAVTGGWGSSLTNLAARFIRSARMTDEVADKLSKMLMSKNPTEVAAVVKMLEDFEQKAAPKAARATAAEMGATTGLATSIFPPPSKDGDSPDIEKDISAPRPEVQGPDIEADLENRSRKK